MLRLGQTIFKITINECRKMKYAYNNYCKKSDVQFCSKYILYTHFFNQRYIFVIESVKNNSIYFTIEIYISTHLIRFILLHSVTLWFKQL